MMQVGFLEKCCELRAEMGTPDFVRIMCMSDAQ